MKLNEIMKKTGLTKKAVYHYEEEGLVVPSREQNSGYRIYSDRDLEILLTIHLLRKLDVPIKEIKAMLSSGGTLGHTASVQLNRLEREVDRLCLNRSILRQLADPGNEPTDEEITEMIAELDEKSKNTADYMMKELDRILPGNLGKLFAIHYGQFLDEPLDTAEKEKAWRDLVEYLDECAEIVYPEPIGRIVDSMYKKIGENELKGMADKAKDVTDRLLARKTDVPEETRAEILEKIRAYEATDEYKDFLVFQEFVKDNLAEIFEGVDRYMRVISDKFDRLQKLFHNGLGGGTI